MTPNSDFQFMYKESGNSMTTAKLQSARLLPHWRPSRGSVRILVLVESGVTISKSVKKFFFYIVMKFEHFKNLTLNLEVPQ